MSETFCGLWFRNHNDLGWEGKHLQEELLGFISRAYCFGKFTQHIYLCQSQFTIRIANLIVNRLCKMFFRCKSCEHGDSFLQSLIHKSKTNFLVTPRKIRRYTLTVNSSWKKSNLTTGTHKTYQTNRFNAWINILRKKKHHLYFSKVL